MSVDYTRLKTNLNLIMHRLKLVEKKKIEQNSKARRIIADLITSNKVDRARIKVEQIVLQDYLVEAMDMIEQFCDLLLSRFGQIKSTDTIDEGLQSAISSLLWVTPRLESEVPELKTISEQLSRKYGKQYVAASCENHLKTVSESLMKKMGVQAPSRVLIENYLVEIAKDQKVDYKPDQRILKQMESATHSNFDVSSDDDESHRQSSGIGFQGSSLIDLSDHYPINSTGYSTPFNALDQSSNRPPPIMTQSLNIPGPIGFVVPSAPDRSTTSQDASRSEASTSSSSTSTKRVQKSTPPSETSTEDTIPPGYDTVVDSKLSDTSHYYSFSENSHSRENLNDSLPELPPVPNDLKKEASTSNSKLDESLDFDVLTQRFEELKKK